MTREDVIFIAAEFGRVGNRPTEEFGGWRGEAAIRSAILRSGRAIA